MTHQYHPSEQDKQHGLSGKVENDKNKQGNQEPTQRNEGRRNPHARNDRDDKIGNNQSKMRRGSPQGSNTQSPPQKSQRGQRQ